MLKIAKCYAENAIEENLGSKNLSMNRDLIMQDKALKSDLSKLLEKNLVTTTAAQKEQISIFFT